MGFAAPELTVMPPVPSVRKLLAPLMVTATLSLKVRLWTLRFAPKLTLLCCVAPAVVEKNTSVVAPGTTPPAKVPPASDAQLLVVPNDRLMAPVAPTT